MVEPPRQSPWSLAWPRALGGAAVEADFRSCAEDFQVYEQATPDADEKGEHVYLQLQKRAANTPWVARQLAGLAGVRVQDVGFCGLKDRHALTTQWFSVWLGQKPEPEWQAVNSDEITLLRHYRGARKLRRGDHSGNRFAIRLRNIRGDRDAAEQRLAQLGCGVPNYFGEQRFGRDGSNLDAARQLLTATNARLPRSQRAFAISAARSWLFNQVLAQRVRRGDWRQSLSGESAPLPTGPLWGRGRNPSRLEQLALEQSLLAPWGDWCEWLEHCGLSQERRALILRPVAFEYVWQGEDLSLRFTLPVGGFATALLRELAGLSNLAAGKAG